MSTENGQQSPEPESAGLNFEETKLTLGLPGETRGMIETMGAKSGTKRAFSETIDLNLEKQSDCDDDDGVVVDESSVSKPPAPK